MKFQPTIQSLIQRAFKSIFRLTEIVAPPLADRWAAKLFVEPMKFKRPAREAALLETATVTRSPYNGFYPRPAAEAYVVRYSWGVYAPGTPTVLLVHGWAGRGSQMATMAAPLVNAGYHVVTFDAPAHGDSPGDRTNLLEVSALIQLLSEEYGGFAALIGHSFGGMAAGHALFEGAKAEKLITIGSPVTMASVLDGFGHQLNASARTLAALKRYIEGVAQRPIDTFSLSYTLANSSVPGLIVHDDEDRDVAYTQAQLLHEVWVTSRVYLTKGLGHRRILRDKTTIARVVAFITDTDTLDPAAMPHEQGERVETP